MALSATQIKRKRQKLGLTKKQVATRARVSLFRYSLFEHGLTEFGAGKLRKIESALRQFKYEKQSGKPRKPETRQC